MKKICHNKKEIKSECEISTLVSTFSDLRKMDNVTNCSVVRSSLCYNCYEKNSSYGEKFENPFLVTHTKIIFTIAFTAVCSVCVLGKYMEPYINLGY